MDDILGMIRIFGGNFAPVGYLQCNGQTLPISQYTALFSLLGTMYGGDGVSTFALPNLNGRAPIGLGQPNYGGTVITEGAQGGAASQTLTLANIPPHTHAAVVAGGSASLAVTAANATVGTPTAGLSIAAPGTGSGRSFTPSLGYDTSAPNITLNAGSVHVTNPTVTNSVVGNGTPINTMSPYLGVMFVICYQGIYPTRP